jgi:hypothetical protein
LIFFSLGLLAFAVTDLVRWHPTCLDPLRSISSVVVGVGTTVAMAMSSGAVPWPALAIGAVAAAVLLVWVSLDYLETGPIWGIALVGVILIALFSLSGSAEPLDGSLTDWYEGLAFPFVKAVSLDQFVLGVAAALFLLATTNRVVRLVLDATLPGWKSGEDTLKGGRVLGPLERVIVGAIVLAGDPAAAAIVIAAKGLLRFPEIREGDDGPGPEAITEYFLIGTLTSLLIAVLLAVLVATAG